MEPLTTTDMCKQASGDTHAFTHAFSKFSTCLDEVMYGASLDFPDDTTGSVDWQYHVAMVHVDCPHVGEVIGRHVLVPAGSYLVQENDRGHVYVTHFEDRDAAEREFAALDEAYSEWLGDDV